MKIVAVRSYLKKMALTKPYTIAYNTFTDVSLAFFEVELENGMIGYGSGSPAKEVVGETTEQTANNLNTAFVQNLVGRDIRHFQQIIFETIAYFPHLPGTQAAIDIALHDAFGKFIGCSVAAFYGQKMNGLPTSVTIGIKNVAETLQEAKDYQALGFKILKVKTGLNLQEDIERVVKLKEQFGNQFKIRVDANQGYTIETLNQFIAATKGKDLELIEQPMPVGTEQDLMSLSWEDRKLLAADESLKNPQAALQFASNEKPFGIYNIKLMKCGGIVGAWGIANIANNAAIDLFWGCNDESIVSITAALHIAYACPNTKYIDLDGSFDLAEDLVKGGFEIINGEMHINNAPGFGFKMLS
jgi:L-alanine-DL-glutamate epimerase-like enolase superfamily enzyme